MDEKKVMELLKDKETFKALKEIGWMRDEIWLMHREINKKEYEIRKMSMEVQNKHNLDFAEYLSLNIIADAIFETNMKQKKEGK